MTPSPLGIFGFNLDSRNFYYCSCCQILLNSVALAATEKCQATRAELGTPNTRTFIRKASNLTRRTLKKLTD